MPNPVMARFAVNATRRGPAPAALTEGLQLVRNGVLRLRRCLAVALALAVPGCSTVSSVKDSLLGASPAAGAPGHVSGFLGGVVADEPRAAVVGRDVLSEGGTAADAAVAVGFALAVTLPSRAGLGGGGACLAYNPSRDGPGRGAPQAIVFVPPAPARAAGGDRPAAVPALARGLFALHAGYGRRPFESLLAPAEQMARLGVPASRAFATDLALVSGPLFGDPAARAAFSRGGVPLADGDRLVQPDLGSTLAQLRVAGVGDFYQGALAHRLADGAPLAGASFSVEDLRATLPRVRPPVTVQNGRDSVAFLPPPADGGLAAAGAFSVLQADPTAYDRANARALAIAGRWRATGGDPRAVLAAADLPPGILPELPASTTFLTLDREGNAVACALTMNNLFGTGRVIPGTGVLLAASPAAFPPPLLASAIAWNPTLNAFRAAAGGSGQAGAPLAAAVAMTNALRTGQPMSARAPDPGRANVIACSRYLPGGQASCAWAADPRDAGLAIGGSG